MIEILTAVCVAVAAYIFGRSKGRSQERQRVSDEYDSVKSRIDTVGRVDGPDVVDGLRRHAK